MPSPLEGKTNVSAFGGFCKCGPGLFAGCQRQAEVGRAGCLRRARHITVVPDPDDVVTRANAWAQGLGGDQLERIQHYSADEVPETPLALKQREPQDARSRSWYWWRHRHRTAYSCESCGVDRGADTNFAGDFREASGTHAHTRGDGGGSSTPPRTCISLAKAIGFLSYDWIAWSLNGPCGTSETDATTEKYYFPGEDTQGLFLQSGSSRDCLGGFTRGNGFDAGSFGAVKGFDQSGGAPCSEQLRPFFRSQQLLQCALEQRGDWQGKASVGASCPQGCFFQQCHSEHGEKDAAGFAVGGGTFGVEGQGDYTHSIPGALWWFCSLQGHRVHHLAGCDVPQSYDGRESCSSQIQPESPLCVPGADCNGLWEHASWVASFTAGGSTSVPFHEQIHCLGSSSSSFRTNSPSTVGHDCPPVSQRDGHYYQQASRGCWRKTGRRQSSSRLIYDGCELGANPKEKSKGKVRWEGPEESSTPAGGRGDLNKNLIFEEEISYRRLLACLPRWILRTHTGFASFLARTFHIQRNGNSLASAIFPVPLPRLGLFRAQPVPKLSKRKWASLCAQRVLHVAVATV